MRKEFTKEMLIERFRRNPKFLIPTTKRKNGGNRPCFACGEDIVRLSQYVQLHYNDGFSLRGVGVFHPECYERLLKNKKDERFNRNIK